MPYLRNVQALPFISENPATAAYRDAQRFDLQQRAGEGSIESQGLANEYARASMPARLYNVQADASRSGSQAEVARQTVPYEVSRSASEADLGVTRAGLARATAPYQVSQAESGARTSEAGADVAQATVQPRIAQSVAAARSAGAGARTAESGANVAEQTEATRVKAADVGLRSATAGARTAESGANVAERTEGSRVRQQEAATVSAEMQPFYKAIDAAIANNIQGAKAIAARSGQNIPDSVWADREFLSAMKNGAQYAEKKFPGRPRDQDAFMQRTYIPFVKGMKDNGQRIDTPDLPYLAGREPFAEPQAPPVPQETAATGHNYQLTHRQEIGPDGKPVTKPYRFDTRTGELVPMEGEGAFVGSGRGAGAGSKVPGEVFTANWLVEKKIAPNEAAAWDMVRTARGNPEVMYQKVFSAALTASMGNTKRAKEAADLWLAEYRRHVSAQSQPSAAPTSPAPQSPPGSPGTESNPHRPATQADFDGIPKGAIFINPADGRPYRKN